MRTRRVEAPLLHVEESSDEPLAPQRREASTTLTRFEHAPVRLAPSPPDVTLERLAQAAETWARLERAVPSLASQLPDFCRTPTSKLLFVVSSRALSTLTGPLSVPLGATDTVRRAASGVLELHSAGKPPLVLNDGEGDFARLLLGAQRFAAAGAGPFDGDASSVEALLAGAVRDFHANPAFTGGGQATSHRGGRAFRFQTFEQVLVSSDPSQRGFECLASATFHLYQSMGLVPADATREELERRYTVLHGASTASGPRLGPEFSRSLRGGRPRGVGERRLDAQATADFANALRATDWAKLTGAAHGRSTVRRLDGPEALVKHFAEGGAGVHTTWANGGHYFVLTGASWEDGALVVEQDDSLGRALSPRSASNPRPNRRPFDPAQHTRFWTLDRQRP